MAEQWGGQGAGIIAKPLREQIYEYLRDEMRRGSLRPGALINVNDISQRLGVSKTPLRDALIQLECDGFVSILPRRGVVVTRLTMGDVTHAWEICRALEPELVLAVFNRIDEACLAEMERVTLEMRRATEAKDAPGFHQHHAAFHRLFLRLSVNPPMGRILELNTQRLADFLSRWHLPLWEANHCDAHAVLIRLLRGGDAAAAAHFLKTVHWSLDDLERHIRPACFEGGAGE